MKNIHLQSPAKLNLSLKVLGKRPDGYHNLSTLFEKINLYDDIYLRRSRTGKIRIFCTHPQVPKGAKNLAYQAARMLQDDFALANGVDIKIVKRIPVAAGLAGGSSNAAMVLLGLNAIWRLDLNFAQLLAYAKRLGSDVPLFLYKDIFCHGTERGDRIKGLKINRKYWHIVVTPRLKVYSAKVFKALIDICSAKGNKVVDIRSFPRRQKSLYRSSLATFDMEKTDKMGLTKTNDNVNILTCALRKNDLAKASQLLLNDLETAIVRVHPQLLTIKNNIKTISGLDICFSGSGPSLFGLVSTQSKAKKIAGLLAKHYARVFVVRTG